MDTTQITDTTTGHDHMMDMDEWWNSHESDEPYPWPDEIVGEQTPRRCAECARPAYYDESDDSYHHAVAPEIGCFLIGSEGESHADPTHPLCVDAHWHHNGQWVRDVQLVVDGYEFTVRTTALGQIALYAGSLIGTYQRTADAERRARRLAPQWAADDAHYSRWAVGSTVVMPDGQSGEVRAVRRDRPQHVNVRHADGSFSVHADADLVGA